MKLFTSTAKNKRAKGSRMKDKLGKAIVFCVAALLTACISGCSAGESNVELIGAFHPQTGVNDPADIVGDGPADTKEWYDTYVSTEKESDTYSIFVVVEVKADDKENFSVGNGSPAKLVVDDTNEYPNIYRSDIYGEKMVIGQYRDKLDSMGIESDDVETDLMGGSGKTRRGIFCFCISPADYRDGKVAHLDWDSVSLDFDLKEIREVDTPSDMVDILAEK